VLLRRFNHDTIDTSVEVRPNQGTYKRYCSFFAARDHGQRKDDPSPAMCNEKRFAARAPLNCQARASAPHALTAICAPGGADEALQRQTMRSTPLCAG
jgi:hypothetical protein